MPSAWLLALCAAAGSAQASGELTVRVEDPESGAAIEGAVVEARPGRRTATTGADGTARVPWSAAAPLRLRVTKDGFEPASARVPATALPPEEVVVRMRVAAHGEMPPVTVTASRDARTRGVPSTRLHADEVAAFEGPAQDPIRVLHLLPGVVPVSDLSATYSVRGGFVNENLIVWDGVAVRSPFHMLYVLGGFTSIFNPELVSDFTFYPGGFPARFGDRLSSVVDFSSRGTPRGVEPSTLRARAGVVDASLLFRTALGERSGMHLAVRRTYYDRVAPRLVSGVDAVWPSFFDLQAKAEAELPGGHALSAWVLDYDDSFAVYDVKGTALPGLAWDATGFAAGFGLSGPLGESLRHALVLGQNANAVTGRLSLNNPISLSHGELYYQASEEVSGTVGDHLWRAGVQWNPHRGTLEGRLPTSVDVNLAAGSAVVRDEFVFAVDPGWQEQFGAYLEPDVSVAGGLRLQPGIRFDRAAAVATHYASPRLSATFERGPFKMAAGWGLYGQSPELLFFVPYFDLPPPRISRAEQVFVTAAVERGGWVVQADAYRKRMQRMTPVFGAQAGPGVDAGEPGRSRGAEFFLQRRMGEDVFGWISYTHSIAERQSAETGDWFPFEFDVRRQFTAALTLDAETFRLTLRCRRASGRPYTPIERIDLDPATGAPQPVFAPIHSARLPEYLRLDVRADYRWRWGRTRWAFYLDVLNATDHVNIWDVGMDETGKVRAIAQFPLLPTLGLAVEW